TLTIENVADTAAAYSMVFLDRFSVRYPRAVVATGGRLAGAFAESGTAAVAPLSGPAAALDTTGATPVWLRGVEPAASGAALRVEAGRSYAVTALASTLHPAVAPASATGLRRGPRADYVVVAPRAFLAAAAPLLELRRAQGLAARAVAFEDVADEFG